MKKSVIYLRTSKTSQSYTRQETELKEYCKNHSIKNYCILKEKKSGYSKTVSRKKYELLKKLVEEEEISQVIVWELSRLGRNIKEIQTLINDCCEKKINIYIYNNNISLLNRDKTRNPYARLIIDILANLAEMESERNSERIISGLQQRKKSGGHIGGKIGRKMKTENVWSRYSSKKNLKEDLKTLSVRKCSAIHKISPVTILKLKKLVENNEI